MIQHENPSESKTPEILCFGEISWDRLWLLNRLPQKQGDCHIVFEQEGPGGCALNSAFALQVLGAKVTLSGNPIGTDARGESIARESEKRGIKLLTDRSSGVRTPFCQCLVHQETAEREFILAHNDIQRAENASLKNIVLDCKAGKFSHAFIQPYTKQLSFELMSKIQDTPLWILIQDVPADSPYVALANANQISLEDGDEFTRESLAEKAQPFFRGRLEMLIVTAGSRGVAVIEKDGSVNLWPSTEKVNAIDTTGCGDAFRAGFLLGLARKKSLKDAVLMGQKVGAYKATIRGSILHEIPKNLII